MGARGPAPKPTALKLLEGTYRSDRAPQNEPQPEVVTRPPDPPRVLRGEAIREWRRIVPLLIELQLFTKVDRQALTAYCQAFGEWWAMERDLSTNGYTQITETGWESIRPQVSIRDNALNRMHKFLREFGLSPSARTRINVQPPKEKKKSRFERPT